MTEQRKKISRDSKMWKVAGACMIVVLAVVMLACACSRQREKESSINKAASQGTLSVETEASQSKTDVPSETPVQAAKATAEKSTQAQAKLPRLLDLGADKCIPCKMMAPLLEELKQEYAGRLEIEFIDVWKNPKAGRQYGIRVIPTQIFYDMDGKEFRRHQGFIGKADILAVFKQEGISLTGKTEVVK